MTARRARLASLAVALAAALAVGAALIGDARSRHMEGPNGVISFSLPPGWEPIPGSSGTRFRPVEAPADKVEVQVLAFDVDTDADLVATERDQNRAFLEENGEEVLFSTERRANGFHVFELAYRTDDTSGFGPGVMHEIHLVAGRRRITTFIRAADALYPVFLQQFRATVDSIRLKRYAG